MQQAQQPVELVPAVQRTHTCISCQVPIAVHGRLVPCKHAFCLECATEMPKCAICCANIQVVERVAQPLYISSLSLRTYFTEHELQLDTRQMFRRIQNVPALADAYQQYHRKRVQQGAGQQQQQQQVPGQSQQQQAAGQLQQQQQQPYRQQLVQQH